jgi:hypothetical protein
MQRIFEFLSEKRLYGIAFHSQRFEKPKKTSFHYGVSDIFVTKK